MSLSIGNKVNGIIPRGALAQVRSSADTSNDFMPVQALSSSDQRMLQHGRARDLAGTMPAASWQVLADAHEHPSAPDSRQVNGSYGYVAEANHKHANPGFLSAA